MWFLTHDGIDRYNGKEFKHYKLMDGEEEVNSMMSLSWLYTDAKGRLWKSANKDVFSATKANMTVSNWYTNSPKSETKRFAYSCELRVHRR